MSLPPRARVRDLVLRLLGLVHLIAFLSLWAQLDVLMGRDGLLPAARWLAATPLWSTPSLFHLAASDGVLHAGAALGVLASVALMAGFAPRLVLPILWALYLSFATAGSRFFEFQWDTLLIEATFVLWFAAPWGWWPKRGQDPGPAATLLVLGLVFKLHFESGLAKLVSGDPSWRDLTAMVSYYETAPLPTPLGWWAHQLPVRVHQATAALVLGVEVLAPILVLAPHRVRGALFAVLASLQVGTELTANYGFFNVLTIVLCVFVLDDAHLAWLLRRPLPDPPPPSAGEGERRAMLAIPIAWALLSLPPFLQFCRYDPPGLELYEPLRTVNAYHLFAGMTLVRREVVIEGSLDGETWEPYELRWKPGDPRRAPRFVAPHQPRVDFLLWFARLGSHDLTYLERLCGELLDDPSRVRSLFERLPFDGHAPRFLRIATYQYGFTDLATRRETGAWWERERLPRETSLVMKRRG